MVQGYQEGKLCRAVVERIAAKEGVDPVALEPRLHRVVDIEAVRSVVDHWQRQDVDGRVCFDYLTYRVVIESDGTVTIDESE